MEDGTGCVHTAPGHGAEDFVAGRELRAGRVLPGASRRPVQPEGGPTRDARVLRE
jgi:isoleucyl-tRNA synthetase